MDSKINNAFSPTKAKLDSSISSSNNILQEFSSSVFAELWKNMSISDNEGLFSSDLFPDNTSAKSIFNAMLIEEQSKVISSKSDLLGLAEKFKKHLLSIQENGSEL